VSEYHLRTCFRLSHPISEQPVIPCWMCQPGAQSRDPSADPGYDL
jgi:hypothetical protein